MTTARAILVLLVASAVVALATLFEGGPPPSSVGLEPLPIPGVEQPGGLSSTWFCAAGNAAAEAPLQHDLLVFNPSGENVAVTVSAYNESGLIGSQSIAIQTPGPTRVDVNATFGGPGLSAMVESPSADMVVEHRISGDRLADQVPCATSSSDRWYFPAQTTLSNTDMRTTAQIYLFNPFAEDASVDISAALPESINSPQELQGLVVAARSARVIDLSVAASRRDQFSVAVETRRGQIIAESAQFQTSEGNEEVPASRGVRLTLGVPRASADLVFSQGFSGAGVTERLAVYNPGEVAARVLVQVTPYGAADLAPEPFELEVPARLFSELPLSAETRIPGEGLHSIRVQTDLDTPVVAGRVITISDAPSAPATEGVVSRPSISRGLANGTGSPVASLLWVAAGIDVGAEHGTTVAVHNPGQGTARFSATIIGGPQDSTVLVESVEVAPGDSVAVETSSFELDQGTVTVMVESTEPVVVERTIVWQGLDELAMGLAVPLSREGARIVSLSGA